jgi:starch-binding outer membrane protein, SusD/RagB family
MQRFLGAAMLAVTVAGCSKSEIDITNPNSALASGVASDPTALQLLATGLMVDQRGTRQAFITNTGTLGREMYTFTPNEGRNTTHYLIGITVGGVQKLDPTGFAVGSWGGEYGALRDIYNFKNTINASSRTTQEKSAALGFAETLEGLMLFQVLQTRDSLGLITEITANPFVLAPFVTRDSGYKYVLSILDDAAAKLAAGGGSFPFTLAPGFGKGVGGLDFNTPGTFLLFNRAIKGKAAVHYATRGGGSAAWQTALTALAASFLNASGTSRTGLDVGVYDTYGAAPDSPNGLTQATNTTLYAHMSIQADVQSKANGQPDDRYAAKVRSGLASRQGPVTGSGPTSATSTLGFSIWPTISSAIPIIRNEELILLRAEAKLGSGDKAGAIADLNLIRTNSGGLPASTLTAASSTDDILSGILYEKRYSLLMEGDRWVDMRRYNRLNQIPLDVTSGANKNFVAIVMPIPQAECLNRIALGGNFIGPNGLNDCAP